MTQTKTQRREDLIMVILETLTDPPYMMHKHGESRFVAHPRPPKVFEANITPLGEVRYQHFQTQKDATFFYRNAIAEEIAQKLGDMELDAFTAGWWVNAVQPEDSEHSLEYLKGCIAVDWLEYYKEKHK